MIYWSFVAPRQVSEAVSRVLGPTRHIIGYFGDDGPWQALLLHTARDAA